MNADIKKIVENTWVKEVLYFSELPSTNDFALQLNRKKNPSTPVLVWAGAQSAGRGQGKNKWFGKEGALLFSLLWPLKALGLRENSWPFFSLHSALALCRAIEPLLPEKEVTLKWPNDVYIKEKKCAGILVEPANSETLIIGMGVNVRNKPDELPIPIRNNAISIYQITNEVPALYELLIQILNQIEKIPKLLKNKNFHLSKAWSSRCILTGKRIILTSREKNVMGICKGIDDKGALLISHENKLEKHYSGTIRTI